MTRMGRVSIALLLSSILSSGCVYKQWSSTRYEDPKMASYWSDNTPPKTHEFAPYYVNGAFVRAFVRAHDQAAYQASAPYAFFVNVYGITGRHQRVTIHSMKILSSQDVEHRVSPIDINGAGGFVADLSLPQTLVFKPMLNEETRSWARIRTRYDLDLDAAGGESVVGLVDVEVESISGVERTTVRYEFAPIPEVGNFQKVNVWDTNKR